jgi:hypothetical protein
MRARPRLVRVGETHGDANAMIEVPGVPSPEPLYARDHLRIIARHEDPPPRFSVVVVRPRGVRP